MWHTQLSPRVCLTRIHLEKKRKKVGEITKYILFKERRKNPLVNTFEDLTSQAEGTGLFNVCIWVDKGCAAAHSSPLVPAHFCRQEQAATGN